MKTYNLQKQYQFISHLNHFRELWIRMLNCCWWNVAEAEEADRSKGSGSRSTDGSAGKSR